MALEDEMYPTDPAWLRRLDVWLGRLLERWLPRLHDRLYGGVEEAAEDG